MTKIAYSGKFPRKNNANTSGSNTYFHLLLGKKIYDDCYVKCANELQYPEEGGEEEASMIWYNHHNHKHNFRIKGLRSDPISYCFIPIFSNVIRYLLSSMYRRSVRYTWVAVMGNIII